MEQPVTSGSKPGIVAGDLAGKMLSSSADTREAFRILPFIYTQ